MTCAETAQVNVILDESAFLDSFGGALIGAGAASDTSIGDSVSHSFTSIKVYYYVLS